MSFVLQPWQFLLIVLTGWINRDQQAAIEYLRAENRVLKELLRKNRVLLNDDQRRRLAVPGKVLGLQRLKNLAGIVTPEKILRWHRQLIAAKWDHSSKRSKAVGRPATSQGIVDLVLRFARENPTWGYNRLQQSETGFAAVSQTRFEFVLRKIHENPEIRSVGANDLFQ